MQLDLRISKLFLNFFCDENCGFNNGNNVTHRFFKTIFREMLRARAISLVFAELSRRFKKVK
jgi:hypothetical protein